MPSAIPRFAPTVLLVLCTMVAGCGQWPFTASESEALPPAQRASDHDNETRVDARTTEVAPTGDWRCGDLAVRTRQHPNGNDLELELPGGWHRLQTQPAASGVRHTDDAGLVFWRKEQRTARMQIDDGDWLDCVRAATPSPWSSAEAGHLALRAAGTEPFWLLEISRGAAPTVILRTPSSSQRLRASNDQHFDAERPFHAHAGELRTQVEVLPGPCFDAMSGHRFPVRVQITLDDAEPLTGCGRLYTQGVHPH